MRRHGDGDTLKNTYDAQGRVTDQFDPVQVAAGVNGRALHFDYSVAGQTTVTDPDGRPEVQHFTDGYLPNARGGG